MIKKVTIILVIIFVLAIAGKVLFDNFDGIFQLPPGKDANDNSVWQYEIHDGKTVITAYKGKAPVLTVPEELDGYTVDELGDDVFSGNTRIKEIIIPETIRITGSRVFENCTELTRITMSSLQKTIPSRTFSGCVNLRIIQLPYGITSIGSQAFNGCSSLTYIEIPDSVTTIGTEAFQNCSALSEIMISKNLRSLGFHAFRGTAWYSAQTDEFVTVGDKILIKYNGIAETVEVPLGITQITDAFEDNIFPIEIILPSSLTSVGPHAFSGCRNLERIEIPISVRSIGESAFRGCSHLNNVTLPERLTQLGTSAFQSCSAITRMFVPEGVKTLPSLIFANCENLRVLEIPSSVEKISADIISFSGISDLRVYKGSAGEEFAINNNIPYTYMQQSSGDFIFQQIEGGVQVVLYTGDMYDVVIPEEFSGDKVISISDILFQHNYFVRTITLPETITDISDYSFADMSELRSVRLPNTVEKIGSGSFMNDPLLGDLAIPATVTEIAEDAFIGCPSLVIVAEEGSYAYDWAIKAGIRVRDNKDVSSDLFTFVNPYGSVLISGYDGMERIPELPRMNDYDEYVAGIADEAFKGLEITAVTIPEGYETIGNQSFANDPVQLEITVPRSVISIGNDCFEGTDVVFYGYNGSYAEEYARSHKIKFLVIFEWDF